MSGSAWKFGLGIALAAAVPTAVLHASAGADRLAIGLSAAPFATPRLMLAQLLAALPLGLVLAGLLGRRLGPIREAGPVVGWAALGLATPWLVAACCPVLVAVLDALGVGFLARAAVLRPASALAVVQPWLVLAARWGGWAPASPAAAVAATALLAVLPPVAYAGQVARTAADELDPLIETGRLVRVQTRLEALAELGAAPAIGGVAPDRARRSLADAIGRIDRAAAEPLPADAPPSARLTRAFMYIQLELPNLAEGLLAPLAGSDPDAALLLAALYRDQRRWGEAEPLYRVALERARPRVGSDPTEAGRYETACEGLAEVVVAAGRPEEAERLFGEAAAVLPGREAYFAWQLGRHYLSGGRPAAALERLAEAARLDRAYEERVAPLVRKIRVATPGCVLGKPVRGAVP